MSETTPDAPPRKSAAAVAAARRAAICSLPYPHRTNSSSPNTDWIPSTTAQQQKTSLELPSPTLQNAGGAWVVLTGCKAEEEEEGAAEAEEGGGAHVKGGGRRRGDYGGVSPGEVGEEEDSGE